MKLVADCRAARGQSCPRKSSHQRSWIGLSAPQWLLLATLAASPTACAPKREPLTAGQRAAIYERANALLTNAVLLKPLESGATNTLGFKLAPLLLQEVASTNAAMPAQVVYFEEGSILLNSQPHDQVVYLWRPTGATGGNLNQGVRITLNASGSPVIWEVLADDSGAELIFVAQSLEAAAMKEFGPPPVGRRFAIEAGQEAAPNVVVARVIEDGPVPMGPIVHLNAGSHNVSTLICRCMPAQAKNLLATGTYDLRPLTEINLHPAFAKPGPEAGTRLTRVLRLPAF